LRRESIQRVGVPFSGAFHRRLELDPSAFRYFAERNLILDWSETRSITP
jgi:hypothetical protein